MSEWKLQDDLTEAQLAAWIAKPEIAIDTELHGLRLGRDRVLLVQVGDEDGNAALVRTAGKTECPPRLRKLLEAPNVVKLFHFALTDIAFLEDSFGVRVRPFFCTRTASKLIRTYTQSHGLKDVVREFLGIQMDKEQQQSDWSRPDLSPQQLQYAANDVLYLVAVYRRLQEMIDARGTLPGGRTARELCEDSMKALAVHAELCLAGYGGSDDGWKIDLFQH